METAWMIRSDGTAFPCVCHTYGCDDIRDVEETLAAAEWLYEHTNKNAVRAACMELIYTWGAERSGESADIAAAVLKEIDSRPYRFLTKGFIMGHTSELQKPVLVSSLAELNEEVNLELNQEFLRARYGGLYDTVPGSEEMFFRISSVGFDWYPIIRDFVERSPYRIQSVTIVRDAESTGGKNRAYKALGGHGVYLRYPLNDFLKEEIDPADKERGLTAAPPPGDSITSRIVRRLAEGRSLRELRELHINWERLKQKVKRYSERELELTADVEAGSRS